MFFFSCGGKQLCIDAIAERPGLGRLINCSVSLAYLLPKVYSFSKPPNIFFVAKRDLVVEEELLFDYGDRCPDIVEANPWLVS